jgi:hypothetical protein
LLTGQLKSGSTFLEEDAEYQHIGTAVRYMIDYIWPVIDYMPKTQPAKNIPTAQHWNK